MPHFDEFGGDEWLCQAPNHSGNRVQTSRVPSEWRTDITGLEGAGNCCPPCIQIHDISKTVKQMVRESGVEVMLPPSPHYSGSRRPSVFPLEDDTTIVFHHSETGPRQSLAGAKIQRIKSREPINPLDYADDNQPELELRYELDRLGIENSPRPVYCPYCKGQLNESQGMVGEKVLVCIEHGIVWEDSEDAIRRVY